MKILKSPNPTLNQVCLEADLTKIDTHALVHEMVATLLQVGGRGLAAPQVGRTLRIFVMKYGSIMLTCVNPEITRRGREKIMDTEACLSIPGKKFRIARSKICDLKFTDLTGKVITLKLKNLDARCAQHEIDHLNGIMIDDA